MYIKYRNPGHQCVVAVRSYRPRSKLPKNVPPSTDMKYPTFIVMTANMLEDEENELAKPSPVQDFRSAVQKLTEDSRHQQ